MKKGGIKRLYSTDFKLQILKEYFETGLSRYSLCKKYGLPTEGGLIKSWEKQYPFNCELLSLGDEIITKVMSQRKKKELSKLPVFQTETEKLRLENDMLRRALAYSELRTEAYLELLKLGKEIDGIDLLKKMAPSSNDPSQAASVCHGGGPLRSVWQEQGRVLFRRRKSVTRARTA